MQLTRMFSNEKYKGTRGYLKTQSYYELARTILYFAVSLALLAAGILTTGDRRNLLTIVAVLGCLPACKSAVTTFLYLRYRGCSPEFADRIDAQTDGLRGLYDRVFTSYDKNFSIAHMTVKGNTVCGFAQEEKFDEQAFVKHLDSVLKMDGFKDVTIKIFTDIEKYEERLKQLRDLDADEKYTNGILETLKNVSL